MLRAAKNFLKRQVLRDLPARKIRGWVERELESRVVRAGPFQNMRFAEKDRLKRHLQASAYYPKLLGTYEMEITPFIQEWADLSIDQIAVIGAAEGYYAVGLALLTKAQVTAFEARGTEELCELALLNGISDQITARRLCDAAALQAAIGGSKNPGVFMDIEGGESILLDPLIVPALTIAHILVEVHDCFIPGTTELLINRFRNSHRWKEAWSRPRVPEDFPLRYDTRWFDPAMYYLEYMGERSVRTNWLYLKPDVSVANIRRA